MSYTIIAGLMCLTTALMAPDQDNTGTPPRTVQWVLSTRDVATSDTNLLERWDAAAEKAQSELEKFDVKLASANWLLNRRIGIPVSRVLLRTDTEDDRNTIVHALTEAQTRLDEADALWTKIVKAGELPDAYDSKRAKDLRGLRIMHDTFESLWPAKEITKEARDEAMRNAANDLSDLLIDDRNDVLAAAQLWQGYLYVQRGKSDGALELWPRTLVQLNVPFSVNLYTRLMQCRTLVEKEQTYTAGVALLLNLEQAAVMRMSDAQMSIEAQATIAFVRRQFFTDWRKKLTDEGELDRAAWCSRMVEALDVEHDPGDGVAKMLPMAFAAPDFVMIDKAIARLDEPAKREVTPQSSDADRAKSGDNPTAASEESEDDNPQEEDSPNDNPGG